jgi:hypothetical protein
MIYLNFLAVSLLMKNLESGEALFYLSRMKALRRVLHNQDEQYAYKRAIIRMVGNRNVWKIE